MKSKKIIAAPFLLLVLSLFFAACQFNGVEGSGKVVSEKRPVTADFKSVKVGNGLDVILEQSANPSITVNADDNLLQHIKTTIENGVLVISSDVNSYVNVASKEIIVKMPMVESIKVMEGSSFKSQNIIKANHLELKTKTGATTKISIECEKATVEATEAGSITIEGKAINLETAATTGSTIDAEKLLSNDIIASASTAGNITVNPLVSLSADATTGGSIHYINVPKNLNKKSTTGGSINKQ
ncbi:DUF2807 domain-containing protein [Flavobacterium sp. CYK-4]|uniref:head GIN domain-containing protein n=1 Tax=Flavobacterium lotistagni TaxID=2709660 RepID=UPI00140A35F0|nr:head GIN domain-containing protein [Flavobacterium lotistagni]NHM06316.1 DUF2807 domain-containing protein [Flavobacterium lotistagni]